MNTRFVRADFDVDVLIVGAGPAGVALAIRLRQLGYDVLLASPWASMVRNSHEFETFTPATLDQLELLGLNSAYEAAHRRRVEFRICWGNGYFEARAPGDLIDRKVFVAGLRQCASDAGIRMWGGRVAAFQQTECGWTATLTSSEGSKEAETRSLVDATGRRGLSFSRSRRGHGLVATHAIWSGENLPDELRVAAGPRAWVWGAPASDGRYLTTVFQDPREARRNGHDLSERVKRAVLEAHTFSGASRLAFLGVTGASDATPQTRDAHDRHGLFRAGDAVLTVDPLSSSGVQAALQSAIDTALAIHTLRVDPRAAELVEDFLSLRLERRRAHHAAWTAAFYREGATRYGNAFWTKRAEAAAKQRAEVDAEVLAPLPPPDQPVALDSALRIDREPCAIGDVIELRGAVSHPRLAGPVVFVEGIEVSNLLVRVTRESKALSVIQEWSGQVGEHSAIRIFSWAWRNRLILPLGARLP